MHALRLKIIVYFPFFLFVNPYNFKVLGSLYNYLLPESIKEWFESVKLSFWFLFGSSIEYLKLLVRAYCDSSGTFIYQ